MVNVFQYKMTQSLPMDLVRKGQGYESDHNLQVQGKTGERPWYPMGDLPVVFDLDTKPGIA